MLRKIVLRVATPFLLISFLLLGVAQISGSATDGPMQWSYVWGGVYNERVGHMIKTSDGGYAIAGWSDWLGGQINLVKINSTGGHVWSQDYGGPDHEDATSIVQTSDGGYAIAGHTTSYGVGGDFLLIKINSNFAEQWTKNYGGTNGDWAYSVIQTSPDGGYAIAGFTDIGPLANDNFQLVKTDSDGNQLWRKNYGGPDLDDAHSLVQTRPDGGYAIAGTTGSFGAGEYDFWLVKTDSAGNQLWNKTYGGPQYDAASSVVQTSDGGYAIAGTTGMYGPGGHWDILLVKTDEMGTMLWNKTYGGTGNEFASSVIPTSDGGYAIAGSTNSTGAGNSDFWLVKTDSNGNMQWNKTYGGTGNEGAASIIQTVDGGYALAGSTTSYGDLGENFWLVKVPPDGPPTTFHNYDGLWHTADFSVSLAATDDFSSVAHRYYRVNDGLTRDLDIGFPVPMPIISTEGANNKLEYWSADNLGHVELPHKILTGIKLDKTVPTGSVTINGGDASTSSTAVTLSLTSSDATSGVDKVRYSNDGVWDTEAWENPAASKSWTLTSGNGTKTVYYQVKDNAGLQSSTFSDSIILGTTTKVAAPTFSPAGGSYSSSQNVVLLCGTDKATIRYTVDGSEPSASSTVYSSPVPVNSGTVTIKAKAFKIDMLDSDTASATYTINPQKVSTPNFSPVGDTYSSTQSVTITCATSGATLRYTIDNSDPTYSSAVYSGPISVSSTTTIKTKAFKDGMTDSDIASATYTISVESVKVEAPTFNPPGGTYSSSQSVMLGCGTIGATMRYTVDGSEPNSYSTEYSSPISVSSGIVTIKAKAFKGGMTDSDTVTATYTISQQEDVAASIIPPEVFYAVAIIGVAAILGVVVVILKKQKKWTNPFKKLLNINRHYTVQLELPI